MSWSRSAAVCSPIGFPGKTANRSVAVPRRSCVSKIRACKEWFQGSEENWQGLGQPSVIQRPWPVCEEQVFAGSGPCEIKDSNKKCNGQDCFPEECLPE